MPNITRNDKGEVLSVRMSKKGQSLTAVGYCRYWTTNNTLGMFNCEEHQEFGGPIAYVWTGKGFERRDMIAPNNVKIEHGGWVSDEEWERIKNAD